jgi:hypothetical protein
MPWFVLGIRIQSAQNPLQTTHIAKQTYLQIGGWYRPTEHTLLLTPDIVNWLDHGFISRLSMDGVQ